VGILRDAGSVVAAAGPSGSERSRSRSRRRRWEKRRKENGEKRRE
jgi:hypothetical protein